MTQTELSECRPALARVRGLPEQASLAKRRNDRPNNRNRSDKPRGDKPNNDSPKRKRVSFEDDFEKGI